MRAVTLLLALVVSILPTVAVATPTQFADPASQRALLALYNVDNQEFQNAIVSVTDKAKAAYLGEYMAMMNYTAANSKTNFDKYIKASDRAIDAVSGSRYEANLLCQLYIHRCMVLIYEGSIVSGGVQFWKAYRQFKTAEQKYPDYDPQLPFRGIFNILLSQVPEKWKTVKSLLGLGDGNLRLGFQQIEQYRQKVAHLEGVSDESLIFSFANMFFSYDPKLTDEITDIIKRNPTPIVKYAYILSCGRRQMGAQADSALQATPIETYNHFPLLYHQRGKYALRRFDTAESLRWTTEFFAHYTGISNRTNAYLDMTYAYLLQGKRDKARECVGKGLASASEFDIDKRSMAEARRAMDMDVRILRARLNFEYGRYGESLDALKAFTPYEQDRAEYFFRLGRAYDLLGDKAQAVSCYRQTVALSEASTDYFGPYAAVYVAEIELEKGNTKVAQQYVTTASRLNNGDYKKELDQRIELTQRAIDMKR